MPNISTARHILMIRPAHFGYNPETAASNKFQKNITAIPDEVQKNALNEFDQFVQKLKDHNISVLVFNDTDQPVKTDAVFPNNWISFHPDGSIILYPMESVIRRKERRTDIVDQIKSKFGFSKLVDLSGYEETSCFLEGTGSIVFDHRGRKAYACLSSRTNKELLDKIGDLLGYEPMAFHAYDRNGASIYHTNVMLCFAGPYAIICLESISDVNERQKIEKSLLGSGRELISLSFDQMEKFAGNMLEVSDASGNNYLILSTTAFQSLTPEQTSKLQKACQLLPMNIPTIETIGGGSARCMIAEIFPPAAFSAQ